MFAENGKISKRQLEAILLLDLLGSAVLFLPRELAEESGRAAWLWVLLYGGGFTVSAWLMGSLGEKRGGTAAEWFREGFGTAAGNLLLLGLGLKLLLDGALELRIFGETLRMVMLPETPVWVLSLMLLLTAAALAVQGAECRGRMAEIAFLIVFLPLGVLLGVILVSTHYRRLLPLRTVSVAEGFPLFPLFGVLFQGLTLLYFIFPFLKKRKGLGRAAAKSCLFFTGLVTLIVLLSLAVFGESLSGKTLPALQMLEHLSFRGVFLIRQDVLRLWFFTASVTMYLSGVLCGGSFLGRVFVKRGGRKHLLCWIAALFLLSCIPRDAADAMAVRQGLSVWLNGLYLVLLPWVLYLRQKVREKRVIKKECFCVCRAVWSFFQPAGTEKTPRTESISLPLAWIRRKMGIPSPLPPQTWERGRERLTERIPSALQRRRRKQTVSAPAKRIWDS